MHSCNVSLRITLYVNWSGGKFDQTDMIEKEALLIDMINIKGNDNSLLRIAEP